MVYTTGMVYKGEFANDVICGEGEMYYSPDCKYQGSWVNGLVRIVSNTCCSVKLYKLYTIASESLSGDANNLFVSLLT